jgi:GAF domain-containing protein
MDEQERTALAGTLQTIVIVSMIGAIFSFLATFLSGTIGARVIMAGLILLLAVSLYYLQRGFLLPSQLLTPTALFATITYIVISGNGLHDASFFAYGGVIIVASLTLGQGGALVFAGLIILSSWAIGLAELNGSLVSPGSHLTDISTPVFITILVFVITLTQRTLINRMSENLQRARLNEQKQIKANKELIELRDTLENRVDKRTAELSQRSMELETANSQIQHRAAQFEALAQVSQSITSIRDLHELLPHVASVISDKYGFYHVGVFLLDDASEYAVLTATNSEGGRKMLKQQHRLKVGEQGIVGSATYSGEPRIALDIGKDAVYFNNPDLPNTHSESALPLLSGGKVIGALDVQSIETGAFTNEDIQTLSLLADQVSLAIENARLFEESNKTLSDLQMLMRETTRDAWRKLPERQKLLGYRYNVSGASPLKERIDFAEVSKGKNDAQQSGSGRFVVPIELRGEVIGHLVVQSPTGNEWNLDQQDIIKAVAERVALSAENARLFEETTLRAERERLVTEITGKIRSRTNPQEMIETAINELREALGASRVEIIPQSVDNTGKRNSEV